MSEFCNSTLRKVSFDQNAVVSKESHTGGHGTQWPFGKLRTLIEPRVIELKHFRHCVQESTQRVSEIVDLGVGQAIAAQDLSGQYGEVICKFAKPKHLGIRGKSMWRRTVPYAADSKRAPKSHRILLIHV